MDMNLSRKSKILDQIKVFLMTAFEINDAEFRRLLPKVEIEHDPKTYPIGQSSCTSTVSEYIPSNYGELGFGLFIVRANIIRYQIKIERKIDSICNI